MMNTACMSYCNKYFLFITGFFIAASVAYELGDVHKYEYVTTVSLNEPNAGGKKDVTYRIVADLDVTSVWQKSKSEEVLLLIQLHSPKVQILPKGLGGGAGEDDYTYHISNLDQLSHSVLLVHMNHGKILNIYSTKESNSYINLKKGIASLFQYQLKEGETEEVDASGKCKVVYKSSGNKIIKSKFNCVPPGQKQLHHPNKVLGIDLTSDISTEYEIINGKDIILSASSVEKHTFLLLSSRDLGSSVTAFQNLNFMERDAGTHLVIDANSVKDAVQDLSKKLKVELIADNIVVTANPQEIKNISSAVSKAKESLTDEKISKVTQLYSFTEMVQIFQKMKKEKILSLLKNKRNKPILMQLLDAAAASCSFDAIDAAFEIVKLTSDNLDEAERFLATLAIAPYPSTEVLDLLLKIAKKGLSEEKLTHTLFHAISAMAKSYLKNGGTENDDIVKRIKDTILEKLTKCSDDPCRISYLRSLRNAAIPSTVNVLLETIKKGGKSALEALEALKVMPNNQITDEVKSLLTQVFFQLRLPYDSSSRIVAFEILLLHEPTRKLINDVIVSLHDQTDYETNTYILNRLKEYCNFDNDFRLLVKDIVSELLVGNYDNLAQRGHSSTFTNFYMNTDSLNATYGLRLEMAKGGVMKRSFFQVNVFNELDNLFLFSFGLFTRGLGGVTGSGGGEEETEDATAGMELTFMDVALRPYVFFLGQGELMGHVWSGTASEPTAIFQGNFPLHNHFQNLPMQSGFLLELSTLGGISADAKGSVQISLWNRNAHTIISDRAAILLQVVSKIDTEFINCQVSTTLATEAEINFVTDVEFYEAPFKMCTQMNQRPFHTKKIVKKFEKIPGTQHKLRRTKRVKYTNQGKSYHLNDKNAQLCAQMYK